MPYVQVECCPRFASIFSLSVHLFVCHEERKRRLLRNI